jgi:partner of Y14 and mago protein
MPSHSATSSSKDEVSVAGIVTTAEGETYIPSSVRADGTIRKEIRVRAGYRPPEDVEKYKNRTAEAWKSRDSGGVLGAEGLSDDDQKTGTASSNKNAKRREARKRAKEAAETLSQPSDVKSATEQSSEPSTAATEVDGKVTAVIDKEKIAKGLRKKLRQARELSARRADGETLLPEQLEKVIRINELLRQLKALGIEPEEEILQPKSSE